MTSQPASYNTTLSALSRTKTIVVVDMQQFDKAVGIKHLQVYKLGKSEEFQYFYGQSILPNVIH